MTRDLISREAAMQLARNHIGHTIDINDIARLPAIDAVPVVHGRWEYHKGASVGGNDVWTCSECYRGYNWVDGFGYCPHCGAKMDGDKDALD